MFLLNGNPLSIDAPFSVEVNIPVIVSPTIEVIDGIETITDAGGTNHVIDLVQYPANWLRNSSAQEHEALGITEVADPEPYDDRFYWGVDNPKQLDDVVVTPDEGNSYTQKGMKTQWIAQIKDTAGKLLAQSDWMVIRKVERDIAIPAAVVNYRAAVIAESNRLETAIKSAKTVDAFIVVVNNQNWPV
jgi:hypothetical protein